MIHYENGFWGIGFIFRLRGSVFPKAFIWSTPSAILSVAVKRGMTEFGYGNNSVTASTVVTALSSFITVLGFMLVFRSNQAWSRYWEGAALVQQTRGEWFNAVSSLFAFCSRKTEKKAATHKFQADTVRLMSLLFGTALESLSGCDMPMIDQEGLDPDSAAFLVRCGQESELRCEVILQWFQRSIVLNCDNKVLDISPPILSRVFQELSRGVVNLAAARKINELPFPFHYAQMLTTMLLIYTLGVAFGAGFVMGSWWSAGGTTFFNVLVLWSVNYLAAEIEQPFGTDQNDLPIYAEMIRMNELLMTLLDESALTLPVYQEEWGAGERLAGGKRLATISVARLRSLKSRPTRLHRSSMMVGSPTFRTNTEKSAVSSRSTFSRAFSTCEPTKSNPKDTSPLPAPLGRLAALGRWGRNRCTIAACRSPSPMAGKKTMRMLEDFSLNAGRTRTGMETDASEDGSSSSPGRGRRARKRSRRSRARIGSQSPPTLKRTVTLVLGDEGAEVMRTQTSASLESLPKPLPKPPPAPVPPSDKTRGAWANGHWRQALPQLRGRDGRELPEPLAHEDDDGDDNIPLRGAAAMSSRQPGFFGGSAARPDASRLDPASPGAGDGGAERRTVFRPEQLDERDRWTAVLSPFVFDSPDALGPFDLDPPKVPTRDVDKSSNTRDADE